MSIPLFYSFIALSALGLIISTWAHVVSWVGIKVPEAAFLLIIGIFVVWIPAVRIANSLTKNSDRKDFWKVAWRGAPKWTQFLAYAIFYYFFFNLVLFFLPVFGILKVPDQAIAALDMRFFASGWMAFYALALVTLYSAMQIQKKG